MGWQSPLAPPFDASLSDAGGTFCSSRGSRCGACRGGAANCGVCHPSFGLRRECGPSTIGFTCCVRCPSLPRASWDAVPSSRCFASRSGGPGGAAPRRPDGCLVQPPQRGTARGPVGRRARSSTTRIATTPSATWTASTFGRASALGDRMPGHRRVGSGLADDLRALGASHRWSPMASIRPLHARADPSSAGSGRSGATADRPRRPHRRLRLVPPSAGRGRCSGRGTVVLVGGANVDVQPLEVHPRIALLRSGRMRTCPHTCTHLRAASCHSPSIASRLA